MGRLEFRVRVKAVRVTLTLTLTLTLAPTLTLTHEVDGSGFFVAVFEKVGAHAP